MDKARAERETAALAKAEAEAMLNKWVHGEQGAG